MPTVLQDPDVWKLTVGRWSKQKLDPNKKARDQARKYLLQVGESLAAIGSGKISEQDRETQRKHRRERNYRHTTNRNHQVVALRLVNKIRDQAAWYRSKKGYAKEQAWKEAKRYVLNEWQQTSRAEDKPTILALVNKIPNNN